MFQALALSFSAHWLIAYLYLKRQPLSWSQSLYGYFVGFRNLIEGFGGLVMIPFIKRWVYVPDTAILGAGLATGGLSLILTGLSTVTFCVFLGKTLSTTPAYYMHYLLLDAHAHQTFGLKFTSYAKSTFRK